MAIGIYGKIIYHDRGRICFLIVNNSISQTNSDLTGIKKTSLSSIFVLEKK